ncbi:MAG: phosphate ABC transporter permease subunit PstC [Chloroflexi bacterium]|nr:phosphate ABC transporter permease subunit PstC [Chloroflexota bacterium]
MMRVTAFEGDTITVERGLEDSPQVAHKAGAIIEEEGDKVSVVEFLTGTKWQPHVGEFGVLALVSATLTISLIAMAVALPLGVGAAVYLSEYASESVRNKLKPILEVLAGVPTVVYGYFALTFVTPILQGLLGKETLGIYNMLSAGLVMGIMILPTVASMSEDALRAVPRALREAAFGLGSTKLETSTRIVLPAGISGIVAAFILGISRAVGETMIVAIAAGARPYFTFNPFEAAETMTGHIVRISTGDLSYGTIDYDSLFAIGLTLFLMTLVLNIVSRQVATWLREEYD